MDESLGWMVWFFCVVVCIYTDCGCLSPWWCRSRLDLDWCVEVYRRNLVAFLVVWPVAPVQSLVQRLQDTLLPLTITTHQLGNGPRAKDT